MTTIKPKPVTIWLHLAGFVYDDLGDPQLTAARSLSDDKPFRRYCITKTRNTTVTAVVSYVTIAEIDEMTARENWTVNFGSPTPATSAMSRSSP